MFRTRHTKAALLVHSLVPFVVALYLTWMPLSGPLMVSESFEHMNLLSNQQASYGIFLKSLHLLSSEREIAVYVQIWFFAFAAVYLSLSLHKAAQSTGASLFITALVLLNPFAQDALYSLTPHALFLSLFILLSGFLLSSFSQAGTINLMGIGVTIGLSISLMPLGWVYVPLLILAAFPIAKQARCGFSKAFFLPFITCCGFIFLHSATYNSLHDKPEPHPSAPYVYSLALLSPVEQGSPYADQDPRTLLWDAIEEGMKIARNDIQTLSDFQQRVNKIKHWQNEIAENFVQTELRDVTRALERHENDIMADIATSRIVQGPVAYGSIAFDVYRSLWTKDETPLGIAYGIISLLGMIIGLLFWIRGAAFHSLFASAFCLFSTIQLQTLWVTVCGRGPEDIVYLFSSLGITAILISLLGLYVIYINPRHTSDA